MRRTVLMGLLAMLCVATAVRADEDAVLGDLQDVLGEDNSGQQNTAGLKMPEVPKPEPRGPGYHDHVVAFADREVTYRLFVPDAANHPPEWGLPLLVLQNPGGRPNVKRYIDWAQRRGVIILGINKVSNGMAQHLKPRYQDRALADLDAIGLPVHKQLRFTIGMSGGSADGERFIRRRPKDFAGLVLQGAGSITKRDDATHLVAAVLYGALDPIVSIPKTYAMVDEARERGHAVMLTVYPKLKHEWAPLADQLDALDWLLDMARLTNPFLDDDEKATYRNALLAYVTATVKLGDRDERMKAAAHLLRLTPLRDEPAFAALVAHWIADVEATAAELDDAIARHETLAVALEGPFGALLADADRARVQASIEDLRKQDAVAADWQAQKAFMAAQELERRAGLEVEGIRAAVDAYDRLIAAAPDSRWAAKARKEADPLRPLLSKAD